MGILQECDSGVQQVTMWGKVETPFPECAAKMIMDFADHGYKVKVTHTDKYLIEFEKQVESEEKVFTKSRVLTQ